MGFDGSVVEFVVVVVEIDGSGSDFGDIADEGVSGLVFSTAGCSGLADCDELGRVVMCFTISLDFLCISEMVDKYSTKGSRAWIMASGSLLASAISVSTSPLVSLVPLPGASTSQLLTAHPSSPLKVFSINAPTSVSSALSDPSTAMTAPLISCTGLVGPGIARGGLILFKTRILFA